MREYNNLLLSSKKYRLQKDFWLQTLQNVNPEPILASGRKAGGDTSLIRGTAMARLAPELALRIMQLSKQSDLAVYMICLAGFYSFLHRMSGRNDLYLAGPIYDPDGSDEVLNEVVLFHTTLSGEETFAELLRVTKETVIQAYENQDYPLEKILTESDHGSDLYRQMLQQIVFLSENLHCDEVVSNRKPALLVAMVRDGEELSIRWDFDQTVYHSEEIERFAQYYLAILNTCLHQPQIKLAHQDFLSPEEREKLLVTFNDTHRDYRFDQTIAQIWEAQCAKTPERVAMVFQDQHWSYAEVNQRANQLARLLQAKGVKPDQIVGMMARRSPELVIAILAIFKAGGAYLPIAPEYPAERVQFMLEDSGVALLLTEESLMTHLPFAGERIAIDRAELYQGESTNPETVGTVDDLAYVIYTSGSTGTPKGVLVGQIGVINLLRTWLDDYPIGEEGAILLKSPLIFDPSVTELLSGFIEGGRLVILPDGAEREPRAIFETIQKHRVTHVNFVPAMLQVFINSFTDEELQSLTSLKYISSGGEALSVELAKQVRKYFPMVNFINLYGPTETTICCTIYPVQDLNAETSVPIGHPLPNTQIYIVDEHHNLLPCGMVGELCISGIGLGKGYLRRPELTQAKFVANPFAPGTLMYTTGDLARWLDDGNIEFLGRKDQQVKIRGFRIELGEIEARLLQHPLIRSAVVIDRADQQGEKYLCAYLISERELSVEELRTELARVLPEYMIPAYFVYLSEFPLMVNGKVNRQALPEPVTGFKSDTEYIAPRNPIEEQLAAIWSEVLGKEQIGMADDFFKIGGHSLKATQMAAYIVKELGIEIPLTEIFRNPTIQGLAEYIRVGEKREYYSMERVPEQEYYPASSAQKRLYVLNQLGNHGTSYNIPEVMVMEGVLQLDRLRQVFQQLVQRHESFRTYFDVVDGEIVQRIVEEVVLEVPVRTCDPSAIRQVIDTFIRPFDLHQAPLLRVEVAQVAEDQAFLLMDMHHIIADGESLGVLIQEFAELYQGQELPELAIQYKDFAVWQNQLLQSERMEQQEQYWLEQFAGEIPVLDLPTDYPRPKELGYAGDHLRFAFSEELSRQIHRFAQEQGVTVYMVLLAAYCTLLYRYTGQKDLVVAFPIAGRPHPDLEKCVGMFVNTLAMRSHPSGEIPFAQFVGQVKTKAIEIYENQDYQFEMLVEKLSLKRELNRNTLFDTMFGFRDASIPAFTIRDLRFRPFDFKSTEIKFDLYMNVEDEGEEIHLLLSYRTELFTRETMERLVTHYTRLVQEGVQHPERRLADLEMLTAEEKHRLLVEWNSTAAPYPKDQTLQALFEAQVAQYPTHCAVRMGEEELTYEEFNRRANRLARYLHQNGVIPGEIVALLVERSVEMVVGIWGILKAGCAYLPIDPAYPDARIQYLLTDSGTRVLLTQESLQTDAIEFAGMVLAVDREDLLPTDGTNLPPLGQSTDLAYIIYTSGTTGQPKGNLIRHYSVTRTVKNTNYLAIEPTDRILQLSNYAFDGSILDIFGAHLHGASLILIPRETTTNLRQLSAVLQEAGITVCFITTSLFHALVDTHVEALTPVRKVLVGGERMSVQHAEKVVRQFGPHKLLNVYGPTESTVFATVHHVDAIEPQRDHIPIGRPITNTEIYILDQDDQLVPIGVSGELCIAGDGLAIGYWNQPEMTAEKFVANPFRPGTKMYRTGDRGRWLADGTIEFLGRFDSQVKIRGFRIEPGETQAQILKFPGIKEAVVVVKEDVNTYLCAYFRADDKIAVSKLRSDVAEKLPDYMIPAAFIQVPQFPLTSNGKVDLRALPEPDLRSLVQTRFVAPEHEVEKKLQTIWSEVLGIAEIGIDDDFFALGGHSLAVTKMGAKVFKELNVELPLREVFKTPTIRELAIYIQNAERRLYATIEPVEEIAYYPVSSAQRRLYTIQQVAEGIISYNIADMKRIHGELDLRRFEAAIQRLIQRHESLRTSFEQIDGELVQRIHPQVDFTIPVREGCEEELREIIREFIRPFDLSKAPLMRMELVKLPAGYLLMQDLHHIIADGVSMSILMDDFVHFYSGEDLPELRIQYKDFAIWQNQFFASDVMQKQEDYWLTTFADPVEPLELPVDYPRPQLLDFDGNIYFFDMDGDLRDQLYQLVADTGTTLYMVLLAIYTVLLSRYSGQEDIVVGSPIAGRAHPDLEKIIGMFVNTLSMRNQPSHRKTFLAFLQDVRENVLHAYENQDYPFDRLVEQLQLQRNLGRNLLFDVMFTLQNMDLPKESTQELQFLPFAFEQESAQVDLALTAHEHEDGIHCIFRYRSRLFKKSTISRMAEHLIQLIREVVAFPGRAIADFALISQQEKELLLEAFNDTDARYPEHQTISALFEEQAAHHAERVALRYDGQEMTYGELNRRANRLARVLRHREVGADQIVAILCERNLTLIVGMLAILKSGGAYLPMDPNHPVDRLEYILTDSGSRVLLKEENIDLPLHYSGDVIGLHSGEKAQTDDTNLEPNHRPTDLAYIIYTSGSTGKPKGVMIEQRNVVRLLRNDRFPFDFSENDIWTMFHSPCFDFSVWEIFGALLYGGTLVVIPKWVAQNPQEYLEVLQKEQVTVVNQTPTAFYQLSNVMKDSPENELKVRYIIFGGEALKPVLLKDWKERYPQTRFINMYGITETTVHVTYKEISEEDMERNTSLVGRPIPTLKVYILDRQHHLLPIGVPGELCVAGSGVARGYLNRPELTEEKFIENPYQPEERLYCSGDLARILPDGEIEYLGRIDRQVKIRGFRIELGEIENQLLQHPQIKEVVVVDREDSTGEKYLCAVLVTVDAEGVSGTHLRAFLQERLPEYMIPAYFMPIDQIPQTVNGKVNRHALPEVTNPWASGRHYVAPTNAIEARLVQLWSEILGLKEISVTDNFFEMGGHSLKATKLVALVHKAFGVEIHLKEIFQAPTVAALAEWIQQRGHSIYREIPQLPEQDDYELSYSQQRLWILAQLEPESIAYNMPSVVTLTEEVDPDLVKRVFEILVERHSSLRTMFRVVDGSPKQRILKEVMLPWTYVDLSQCSEDERKLQRERIYREHAQKPFHVEEGPLFRVALVKVRDGEFDVIHVMHHIISDGWSMGILQREFVQCYEALKAGQTVRLPDLPIQYHDFAAWQNELFRDETKLQKVLAFWSEQLHGELPVLQLPYDSSPANGKSRKSAAYRLIIPAEVQAKLHTIALEHHASLFMVLLAGFNLFLARITNQTDLITGIPAAGREHENLKHVIGFFINTVILRNQLRTEESFVEFLRRVQANTLKALEYQSYPLELIFTRLKREYPKIATFFNLSNFQDQTQQDVDNLASYHIKEVQDVKFDLACYLTEYRNGIEVSCHYVTERFDAETIEYIMEEYNNLLKNITKDPEGRLNDYVEVKERRKILW